MSQKRKREFDIANLEEEPNAKVHARVLFTSPVRTTERSRFFISELSDGKKTAKLISFNTNLKPLFDKFEDESKTAAINNCSVQRQKFDKDVLEIKANSSTTVEESPKSFKIDQEMMARSENTISINTRNVKELTVDEKVNISGKIVKVGEIERINGSPARECYLEDSQGRVRIMLWGVYTERLTEEKTCRLLNMNVKRFNGENHLSFSTTTEVVQAHRALEGEVESVQPYVSCINCDDGEVNVIDDVVGVCTSCRSKVKIRKCEKRKKLKFKVRSDTLQASSKVLSSLLNGGGTACGKPLDEKLLNTPEMKFFVDEKNEVIYMTPCDSMQ